MKIETLKKKVSKRNVEEIQKFPEVKRWLRKIEGEQSKREYTKLLIRYCRVTEKTPTQLIKLKKNSTEHQAEDLLDIFVEETQKFGYANNMTWNIVIAVKSFHKWNYQQLESGAGKISRIKVKPYRTPDKESTLAFMEGANPRDKALISLIACTGISEGSIPSLKWSHVWKELIENRKEIPHIGLKSTEIKGKGKGVYQNIEQHTFLTPYASETLLKYKSWLERKTQDKITPEHYMFVGLTKPFDKLEINGVRGIFMRRSKETGITYSPHDFRRFVQTALETARLQPNWIKKILRHKVKGEESPYSQPKIEALRKAYASALPHLDLTEQPKTIDRETMRKEAVSMLPDELLKPLADKYGMTVKEYRLNILKMAKGFVDEVAEEKEDCQKLIDPEQLETHLKSGWKYIAEINGKIVVEKNNH